MELLKIPEGDLGLTGILRIELILEEFGGERFGELNSCRLSRGSVLLGGVLPMCGCVGCSDCEV